jgi:hypothetical protein
MTGANDESRIDVENDADDNHAASDDESGKKRKAPNMSRLLKSRLQKLVDKTDDSYVTCLRSFLFTPIQLPVVEFCHPSSWIYQIRSNGLCTTKPSRGLNVLKISLWVIITRQPRT